MSSVQFLVDGKTTEEILQSWSYKTIQFPSVSQLSYELSVQISNDNYNKMAWEDELLNMCVSEWIIILPENTFQSVLRARALDIILKSSHIGYVVKMYPFWGRVWNDGYGLLHTYTEVFSVLGKDNFQEYVRQRSLAETGTASISKWYTVPESMYHCNDISAMTKEEYRDLECYLDKCYMSIISDRSITRSYLIDVWKDDRYFVSSLYHEVASLVLSSRRVQKIGLSSQSMIIDVQSLPIHGDKNG